MERKKNKGNSRKETCSSGENETPAMDDLELVAVITAAIAAETGTSSDDFVVRSIKTKNVK